MTRGEGVPRPQWRTEAEGRCSKQGREFQAQQRITNIERVRTLLIILEKYIKELLKLKPNPHALIVGPGIENNHGIDNCLEPAFLASFLEGIGVSGYKMDIVDIDPSILRNIEHAVEIYLCSKTYNRDGRLALVWDWYLQSQGISRRTDDGLDKRSLPSNGDSLEVAAVPPSFRRKLSNGDVSLVSGDIAWVNLSTEIYDYVLMRNVQDKHPPDFQRLALARISAATRLGGIVHVNDHRKAHYPLLRQMGGWLGTDSWWLDEIRLKVIDIISNQRSIDAHNPRIEVLFEKV